MLNNRTSYTPNPIPRTRRPWVHRLPTSFRPGTEALIGVGHVFREESLTSNCELNVMLAEMPKPLLNSVAMRVRAWFVPYTAFDRFPSLEAFQASYNGVPERDGMAVVPLLGKGTLAKQKGDLIHLTAGLQNNPDDEINRDFVEAYNQVINYERRNLSKELFAETEREITKTPSARATYINHLFSDVKPSFDDIAMMGEVEVDLNLPNAPVRGISRDGTAAAGTIAGIQFTSDVVRVYNDGNSSEIVFDLPGGVQPTGIYAEMQAAIGRISLSELDRGRVIAQLAQIRDRFVGHEEVHIIDDLMRGFQVPQGMMKEPILLNEKKVQFGTMQRKATDGPNLDVSVTEAVAGASMSVIVPPTMTGGYILVTATVQPDQIFERRADPMLYTTEIEQLPDATRDMLDLYKVDVVKCAEVDWAHTTPNQTYGYSPRNMRFARPIDRVGGYFRDIPENEENRNALWIVDVVDPVYGQTHLLCPRPFPVDIFADTTADPCEARFMWVGTATGLTQFGPAVLEDQGSYLAITDQLPEDTAE